MKSSNQLSSTPHSFISSSTRRCLLALTAVLVCSILTTGPTGVSAARSIKSAVPVFPFNNNCKDTACSSNPYQVSTSSFGNGDGTTSVTFSIFLNASNSAGSDSCYPSLQQSIQEFSFMSVPSCSTSWSDVMVNNIPVAATFKEVSGGNFAWGDMIIPLSTSPYPSYTSIQNSGLPVTVTLKLSGSCPTLSKFSPFGGFVYTLTQNPATLPCCPVCVATVN
ncbi:hypothetical protein CEUSTIGMA_g5392.t1 [Chlamydomonas eustigma]|uniref:Pherophorin domain-containing protein n=1 Tax=Chlamydomonas eustigma TaxID=1157962 RepID=A0A250X5B9_9CHLO|nr:hypothetical protein CEUSTIGMA_g5392.t1 [Chlamydomonas eustigma]|eukprot:GAX77950.1 hypothetical protein CEUSTIGMA_g5392.t1 [Chlamydomonas eustigma]